MKEGNLLHEIGAVVHTNSQHEVNKFISENWVVLAVAAGKDEEGQPLIMYSLGNPNRPR